MNKEEFEKVFAAAAEKSGVVGMARAYRFAEKLQYMMIELRDKLCPTEQPSEELEEAADCYLYNVPVTADMMEGSYDGPDVSDAFIAGAHWQKEQMMKSAVKGGYIKRNRYTKTNVLHGFSNVCDAIQQFKDNDKVRIIIIKEDEY